MGEIYEFKKDNIYNEIGLKRSQGCVYAASAAIFLRKMKMDGKK